jgi:hypothetical protein
MLNDSVPDSADFGFRTVAADERKRLVRGVFDSVAQRYDLMNDLIGGGIHRLWKASLMDWLNPRPTIDARWTRPSGCSSPVCSPPDRMGCRSIQSQPHPATNSSATPVAMAGGTTIEWGLWSWNSICHCVR